MAKKADFKPGDQVQFLRMSNKSVSMAGKIVKIHDDSDCVDVQVEGNDDFVETAHADDVTVVAKGEGTASDDESKDEGEEPKRARRAGRH